MIKEYKPWYPRILKIKEDLLKKSPKELVADILEITASVDKAMMLFRQELIKIEKKYQ